MLCCVFIIHFKIREANISMWKKKKNECNGSVLYFWIIFILWRMSLTIYHAENNFISFHMFSAGIGQNLLWISIVSPFQQVLLNNLTVQGHSEMLHPIVFLNLCDIVHWDSLSEYSTMRVLDGCLWSAHFPQLSHWGPFPFDKQPFFKCSNEIVCFVHFVKFVSKKDKLTKGKCFFFLVCFYHFHQCNGHDVIQFH